MVKNPQVICVVTGSRAEYGLLKWIIKEIDADRDLTLKLIVTGTHLSQEFGNTASEITADGYSEYKKVPSVLNGDDHATMAKSIGLAVASITDALTDFHPDLVLVLGDRSEILAATIAAFTLNIPIAHIHGGEVTSGALDEGYRHAITKMSSLHFVAAPEYQRRVIQMGEQPSRVHCIGAPGLEGIHRQTKLSLKELSDKIGLPLNAGKFMVIAFHPETCDAEDGISTFENLLTSLETLLESYSFLFSKSNADAGGRSIGLLIDRFCQKYPLKARSFTSLGHNGFTSLLSYSKMLIGNSSSGIIEAPAIKIPTVNIGSRQRGRLFAKSIVQSDPETVKILASIRTAERMGEDAFLSPPYGTGTAVAKTLVDTIKSTKLTELSTKTFYDVNWTQP